MFKNVIIRRLVAIREKKSKNNIKQSVELLIKKNQEAEAKKRRKLKKKIEREFNVRASDLDDSEANDPLFNRAIFFLQSLLKILTAHSQAIDSLERKLILISSKKGGRLTLLEDDDMNAAAGEDSILFTN